MSIPIKYCAIVKAVDNPVMATRLIAALRRNLACGHFQFVSCDCAPPCRELSDEEWETLERKLDAADTGDGS